MAKLDQDTVNLIDEIFDLYDTERTQELTLKNTSKLLRDIIEMGGEANPEVIDELVNEMDTNKDGTISKKEFAKMLKKHFI